MKKTLIVIIACCIPLWGPALAQTPPSGAEIARYGELFEAVVSADHLALQSLLAAGGDYRLRDSHGRTALHVAAFTANHKAMRLLVEAGANPNALEQDRYDMVTIAAVANDVATLKLALKLGNRATNITSRYDGTALIAAAHLGHAEVVETLIQAGAPLDHVNNLGWTALIESIVLGDGGPRHVATLRALIAAGANVNLADRRGQTPLTLAKQQRYAAMVEILVAAGAR